MDDSIRQLYPQPGQQLPLKGAYLAHDLRQRARAGGKPFVYSNFLASLDGRIAVPHPGGQGLGVPEQIANDRDWRLFQELAVQADLLITSGRYLRDYAAGQTQEILNVYHDPRYADLENWRLERGLSPRPDLAVISGGLDFTIPQAALEQRRSVLVFTTAGADADRVKTLEDQAGTVIIAGDAGVDGRQLLASLSERGYSTVFSTTGPKVLHLLVVAGVLDRLYLTLANRLLGGDTFSSIVEGALLDPPADYQLNTLYHDPHGLNGLGQLFASYDRATIR